MSAATQAVWSIQHVSLCTRRRQARLAILFGQVRLHRSCTGVAGSPGFQVKQRTQILYLLRFCC